MKLERVRGSILKKGSLIGYLQEEHVSTGNWTTRSGEAGCSLLATTERGVLQDVRDACVIRGIGLETDGEDVVAIISGNVEMFSAGFVMLQVQSRQLQFRDMLRSQQREAVKLLTRLRELRELSDSSSRRAFGCIAKHDGHAEGAMRLQS